MPIPKNVRTLGEALQGAAIFAEISQKTRHTVVTNYWSGRIQDYNRGYEARERLVESLDRIFAAQCDKACNLDAVESKLFGVGAESCTIGSSEFYLGYAITRGILLTLDSGHFHPTEVISDKISSVLLYLKEMLLHVSRPVR